MSIEFLLGVYGPRARNSSQYTKPAVNTVKKPEKTWTLRDRAELWMIVDKNIGKALMSIAKEREAKTTTQRVAALRTSRQAKGIKRRELYLTDAQWTKVQDMLRKDVTVKKKA